MSENPYEPMSKEQKDAIVQGNGLTYTHEQMRQVQHAIAAGKNPLVVLENVPRWEDMAGVDRIINRRVLELDPCPHRRRCRELPLTRQMPRHRRLFARTRCAPACTARTTVCW